MKKIVGAFVGYKPNMDHPFQAALDHGAAWSRLFNDKENLGFRSDKSPQFYGFVVKHDDGHYSFANRSDAYVIARIANQIKKEDIPDLEKCESLNSYNLDKSTMDPHDLWNVQDIAYDLNKRYKGREIK